jgi:hypothetical protein
MNSSEGSLFLITAVILLVFVGCGVSRFDECKKAGQKDISCVFQFW